MADVQPTTGDTPTPVPTPPVPTPEVPTEISKAVETFFVTIEDLASQASTALVTLVKVIVRVKFNSFWSKERVQIKDKITKGLEDGQTKK
jgi:hypothetical protein